MLVTQGHHIINKANMLSGLVLKLFIRLVVKRIPVKRTDYMLIVMIIARINAADVVLLLWLDLNCLYRKHLF